MPADPLLPPSGIPWWKAQKFTGFWQSALLTAMIWTLNGVQSNVWDWRAGLVVPILSGAIVVFRDQFSTTVAGPLSMQNTRNG